MEIRFAVTETGRAVVIFRDHERIGTITEAENGSGVVVRSKLISEIRETDESGNVLEVQLMGQLDDAVLGK